MRPTTKRLARIAGLGVAGLAIAGALWFLLGDPESRGPLLHGKPVTYWTQRTAQRDPAAISVLAGDKAVAIPALVRQLSLRDSRVKDAAKGLWRRLPPMLRAGVPEPTTPWELRREAAFALVMIYQNDFAQTAAPTLSEARLILPALTRALQDTDGVRLNASVVLGHLGVISAQAIEACEAARRDTHWLVRAHAVDSLGRLAKSDERAIPHLKAALSDSHTSVRRRATNALERLGITPPQDDASSATEAK